MLMRTLHRAAAHPVVYDWIQQLVGYREIVRRVASHLDVDAAALVLDVGAGTGNLRGLVDERATYVWLDSDPVKLRGFRSMGAGGHALLGDARRIGLRDRAVACALCVDLSHHLPDDGLARLMQELARVARDRIIFVDAVARPRSAVSRMLWWLDRGSYPRTEDVIVAALRGSLAVDHIERFTVYHSYLLCVGRPK